MVVAMSTAGWVGVGILGLIIWVALVLLFFPLALIMALVVGDRRVLGVNA